jgi:hypothetical protein
MELVIVGMGVKTNSRAMPETTTTNVITIFTKNIIRVITIIMPYFTTRIILGTITSSTTQL